MNNPALASTGEFNRFVQDRLQSSQKAFHDRLGSRDPARGISRERARPDSSARRSEAKKVSDLSQDFFVGNSSRYIGNSNTTRPQSSGRGRTQLSAPDETKEQYRMVHSWRAHLDYKRSPSPLAELKVPIPMPQPDFGSVASPTMSRELNIVRSPFRGVLKAALEPSPGRRSNGRSLFNYDDECFSPRPMPLRAVPHVDSNAQSGGSSPSYYRYRRKVLSFHIAKWRSYLRARRERLGRLEERTGVLHRALILRIVWRDWTNTIKAIHFDERFSRFRGKLALRRWRQLSVERNSHWKYARAYAKRRKLREGLRALCLETARARIIARKKRNATAWQKYRRTHLQHWCLYEWRRSVKCIVNTKQIEEESKERKSKIQTLLSAYSSRASSAPSAAGTRKSTRAGSAPRNGRGGEPRQSDVRSWASDAYTAPPPADKEEGTAVGRTRLSPRLPVPPMVNRSPRSIIPPVGLEALPPPILLPSPSAAQAFAGSATPPPPSYSQLEDLESWPQSSLADHGDTESKTSRNSKPPLDIRAQQRKSRLQDLREQANLRVQQRQEEEERKRRERREKEEADAQQLLLQARQRRLEEKSKSARTLALQADLQRLLDHAKDFRRRQLLIRCGLAPWRRLVSRAREQDDATEGFRRRHLMRRIWVALRVCCETLTAERVRTEARLSVKAQVHYRRALVRGVWRAWRLHRRALRAKASALRTHFSSFVPLKRSLGAWVVTYHRQLRRQAYRMRDICLRGDRALRRHFWIKWRDFHWNRMEEHEMERRMESKWADVQQWLSKK